MRSIIVKHAEWERIVFSQVDYEGRLFGAEVFMRLVIRELKIEKKIDRKKRSIVGLIFR